MSTIRAADAELSVQERGVGPPLLLIAGIPVFGMSMGGMLARSRWHLFFLERPQDVTGVLEAFLTADAPPPAARRTT